ncbi:helix-hairpin-helix domain-containing protein [Guyparkeria hydrothermalis]|uniref:ComEA family DNA-binding protein n=1 Tax=Guyparkeria hydrothermalis TaxID=923 RepID=UPI00202114AB|nr:helix-hairpin-helix domain-containing protein [Guyparkeria hydrothermalis]MCL7744286.1 helix-hairpin-helix domain-containing protein [Guyparkeria hydrothermalis]
MSFFNIGKKDADGRQVRIEHRGRYLRASRTGEVSLRAQTKAAGVNFTGNTAQGIRVSATPVKDTQIALQNGRFILRGRYGRGPTKLNLSKTGVTVSTRNRLGTFNWIKPNRSSAKIAGVQVRGRNAVVLQSIYFAFSAIGLLSQMVVSALRLLVQVVASLARGTAWLIKATPPAMQTLRRRLRNWRLERLQRQFDVEVLDTLGRMTDAELRAATHLAFACWGRGEPASSEMIDAEEVERAVPMLSYIERNAPEGDWHLAVLGRVAEILSRRLAVSDMGELLLIADEAALAQGPRTVLQERMLEVFADFAGLELEPVDQSEQATKTTPPPGKRSASRPASSHSINLNTASLEDLQSLPHIGPERAEDLVGMRPIERIEQLRAIDGIGPARLEQIKAHGVTV